MGYPQAIELLKQKHAVGFKGLRAFTDALDVLTAAQSPFDDYEVFYPDV